MAKSSSRASCRHWCLDFVIYRMILLMYLVLRFYDVVI